MEPLGKRLIIAEDAPAERDVLAKTLEYLGYRVSAAENGREALDLFNTHGADLNISDIQMPEMSGLELLRTLREQGHEIPFIILTGFDTSEARNTASSYRATALLVKPFRVLHLRSLLESILNHRTEL